MAYARTLLSEIKKEGGDDVSVEIQKTDF